VVRSVRSSGSGHKLKHGRFPLYRRRHVFTVMMGKHWHRLPREIVESPSLEMLKSHPDAVLSNWL